MTDLKSPPFFARALDPDAVPMRANARLLLAFPDQPAALRALDALLLQRRIEVVRVEQSFHADGLLCVRMELFVPADVSMPSLNWDLGHSLGAFDMSWCLSSASRPKRCALLVSKSDHCLVELLRRWEKGDLGCEIVLVASNHPDLAKTCAHFGVPFHHIPVDPERRLESEMRFADLLKGACDVVVLARYMRIFSRQFLDNIAVPVINIHHSLLPAFVGAEPYERAKHRGVKLIGATAHYVTEDLDEGPIIEQDIVRVSHRDDVKTLKRLGADVERMVLARAVEWHCDDRLLRHGSSVVVF